MDIRKCTAVLLFLLLIRRYARHQTVPDRSARRWYVHPINLNRDTDSQYQRLVCMLRTIDREKHRNFFRLDRDRFDQLLSLIRHDITHKRTHRLPIPPEARLAMTLRYLATGDSFKSIGYNFHCHASTTRTIVYETCRALCSVLAGCCPKPTKETWLEAAELYYTKTNFPNCAGTVDGKHVTITCPPHSGTRYRNYKGTFSIVLLGVCAADYRFLYFHLGEPGRLSDSRVLADSTFGQALQRGKLNLPDPRPLPGTDILAPFVYLGDEGFPLKSYFLRPFPRAHIDHTSDRQKIFNYRLSRARRISENTFGLLVNRFRVLRGTMEILPENAKLVTKTCILLHNYLIGTDGDAPRLSKYTAEKKGDHDSKLKKAKGTSNNYTKDAANVRNTFADYFLSPAGKVSWQDKVVRRGRILRAMN